MMSQTVHSVYRLHKGKHVCAQCLQTVHNVYKIICLFDLAHIRPRIKPTLQHWEGASSNVMTGCEHTRSHTIPLSEVRLVQGTEP